MKYPTLEEVHGASRVQLGKWFRFLPSPGCDWAGFESFRKMYKRETKIMQLIIQRFDDAGGMDSALSKYIGWSE